MRCLRYKIAIEGNPASLAPPLISTRFRRRCCAIGRSHTTARTSCSTSTMRRAAASFCGGSRRMSLPQPTGGAMETPGLRLRSAIPELSALGVPEESLQSFPEAFRVGMAARADDPSRPRRERSEELGPAVRQRADSRRHQHLQRHERKVGPRHGAGAAAVSGNIRRCRAGQSGLRRPAGRPQSARLQGPYRPARHRGQRSRSVARTWAAHQSG